jgi:hypothetical protein
MIRRAFVLAGLLLATVLPVLGQEAAVVVGGRILDSRDQPAVGYRVVYRVQGGTQVYLSAPADDEGNYSVSVPSGQPYVIVAAIAPNGMRTALPVFPPIAAHAGAREDVALPFSLGAIASAFPDTFPKGDRLFLAFAEDATISDGCTLGPHVEHDEFESGSTDGIGILAAVSFESIPRIEFGARMGYEDNDTDSGLRDLDAWMKFEVAKKRTTRFAVGGLVTAPTGDPDAGTGTDALSSKLFGSMRFAASPFIVSAHVGVRFTGDGEIFGTPLDGQPSFDASAAAIWPMGDRIALVGEAFYEGARFDGFDDDARLLVGVNWKLVNFGYARIAAGTGLTDGAPDWFVVAGWLF